MALIVSSVIDFGQVLLGYGASRTLAIYNPHPSAVTVYGFNFTGSVFSYNGAAVPFNIPARTSSYQSLLFTPGELGSFSETLTISNSAGAIQCTLQGECVEETVVLGSDPSSWDFGSLKVGATSAEKVFTITNVGNQNCEITAFNYTAPFNNGNTTPSLPAVVDPGNNIQVGVVFEAANYGYISKNNGFYITSNANNSPLLVSLAGEGSIITPAYNLTGNAEALLLCFMNNNGISTIRQMNANNLNCEEASYIQKQVNLSFLKVHQDGLQEEVASGYEKTLARVVGKYEDKGTGNLLFTVTSERGENNNQAVSYGSNNATGKSRTFIADLLVTDEVLDVKLSQNGNGGPLSITELLLKFEPKGEVVK